VISAPTPSAISPGGSTTINVTLTAGSNYSGTMNMSCILASSPAGALSLPTCSLSPTSVNIPAGGTGSIVLTVQTTAASSTALLTPTRMKLLGLGGSGTILAGLLLVGVPTRRRRWMAMMVLLWIVAAAGVIGCGSGGASNSGSGGSSIPATTAGAYRFTVAGTDSANSSITASTSVAVTVQ
jgi:trimeric autotransporter adhesin